jgi:fatty-acyl-CoA synthase
MAGSLCPSELMKGANRNAFSRNGNCYGMTETSPLSTQTQTPFDKRVSTVGRVLPHTEIKIIHPGTDQIVPIGETESCAHVATA